MNDLKSKKNWLCIILTAISISFGSYIFINEKIDSLEFFSCILLCSAFLYSAYKVYEFESPNLDKIVVMNLAKGFLYVLNSGLSIFVFYGTLMKIFLKQNNIQTSHLIISFFTLIICGSMYGLINQKSK